MLGYPLTPPSHLGAPAADRPTHLPHLGLGQRSPPSPLQPLKWFNIPLRHILPAQGRIRMAVHCRMRGGYPPPPF